MRPLALATSVLAISALTASAILIRRRIVVVTITGDSMRPTYRPGDRVFVRRSDPRDLKRGQVVVLERPFASGDWIIKRVAALPGDMVPAGNVVPPGKLVVLGDNPAASVDSRQFGYCPADRLLGVVIRRALLGCCECLAP